MTGSQGERRTWSNIYLLIKSILLLTRCEVSGGLNYLIKTSNGLEEDLPGSEVNAYTYYPI